MTEDLRSMRNVPTSTGRIVVYWRPGCWFCASLLRQLDRHGIAHDRVNIWEDDAAASFVRSVARGHETVPTVAVGPVVVINPDIHMVLSHAREHAADAIPESYQPPDPGRLRRWVAAWLARG
jgi:mycoredoxin